MCGIIGLLNLDSKYSAHELRNLAKRMADRIEYRGPDQSDVWVDPTGYCALAHRRLSIIDLTEDGKQPMTTPGGSSVICFNGEIYNYAEIKPTLVERGCTFHSRSDTEVLLHWINAFGLDRLSELDGMYAFAHFDLKTRMLSLARDAFGEKPLYYTFQGGLFAFASELHCLTLIPGFDASIDKGTIAEFLTLQYVQQPKTIYQNAFKLPSGSSMLVNSQGVCRVREHFAFTPKSQGFEGRSLTDLGDELESILQTSLKRRLMSDVPLGAFLSGGVDSSLVVGMMSRMMNSKVNTFSIGFKGAPDSEHLYAREMANHFGTNHHEKVLEPDVVRLARVIGRILDEPNGDSSCVPTYLVSEFARERVTVALSGDGGDELFGGYSRYFYNLDGVSSGALSLSGASSVGHNYFNSSVIVFSPQDVQELMGTLPLSYPQRIRELQGEINNTVAHGDLLARMRGVDIKTYLPGAVLAKVDRMSMQHSLEVRTPFLNREVARFSEQLSLHQCYENRNGVPNGKLVLKELARRYIPMEWLVRKKLGFGLPMNSWALEGLMAEAESLFINQDSILSSWIPRDNLARFVHSQRENFSIYRLWNLYILELWMRSHAVKVPASVGTAIFKGAELERVKPEAPRRQPLPLTVSAQVSAPPVDQDLQGYLDRNCAAALRFARQPLTTHDMSLATACKKMGPESLIVFTTDTVPLWLQDSVIVKLIVSLTHRPPGVMPSKYHVAQWWHPSEWREVLISRMKGASSAVFCGWGVAGLPEDVATSLRKLGITDLFFFDGSSWRRSTERYRFMQVEGENVPPKKMTFASRMRQAVARRVLRLLAHPLEKTLQQRAAARGATLPMIWHDRGAGFAINIGDLFGEVNGKDFTRNAADFLLFEGEHLLLSIKMIRHVGELGMGRYSYWEDTLYFSATDNSDPRNNGRSYRFIQMPFLIRSLRALGLRPEMLFNHLTPELSDGSVTLSDGKRVATRLIPTAPLPATAVSKTDVAQVVRKHHLVNAAVTDKILLFIGTLGSGGAERQVCYFARALHERGYNVTVATCFHDSVNELHYLPFLKQHGVKHIFASSPHKKCDESWLLKDENQWVAPLFEGMPAAFAGDVWAMFTHLMIERPAVLHCWLDNPNLIGAIAGILAGVPRIVLSGRNVNPSHFPYFHQTWFKDWYRTVLSHPSVTMVNNSTEGAHSYESWLKLPKRSLKVIHNGIDESFLTRDHSRSVSAIRRDIGVPDDAPLVVGAFRLSFEKRPQVFLKVMKQVAAKIPNVRAVIMGIGAMREELEQSILDLGLSHVVSLLGRRGDVHDIMAAGDLLLLCSEKEGTPNVVMEAQLLGKPVVSTAVGGVPDLVVNGETGYLVRPKQTAQMAAFVVQILKDPELARKLGSAGQRRLKSEFSVARMVDQSLAVCGLQSNEEVSADDIQRNFG